MLTGRFQAQAGTSTPTRCTGEITGLVAFTFLDEVLPRGGGTLVMPGSHRVTWQLRQRAGGFMTTGEMKSVLAGEYTWFADLWRQSITDRDSADTSMMGPSLKAHTFVSQSSAVSPVTSC